MASAGPEVLPGVAAEPRKYRRRSKELRRRIVEETLVAGASVARVARAHEVNANQVFHWRKLYSQGLLGVAPQQNPLLPVRIADVAQHEVTTAPADRECAHPISEPRGVAGAIHLELAKARVHIEGQADPDSLRVVLECLLG